MYYGASPGLFQLAKQLRMKPTEAELKLSEILNEQQFKSYNFRWQHPIARYIADFYSHPLKLVIEADGGIHQREEQKYYDKFRDEDMRQYGITVLRFNNQEVLKAPDKVIQEINIQIKKTAAGY